TLRACYGIGTANIAPQVASMMIPTCLAAADTIKSLPDGCDRAPYWKVLHDALLNLFRQRYADVTLPMQASDSIKAELTQIDRWYKVDRDSIYGGSNKSALWSDVSTVMGQFYTAAHRQGVRSLKVDDPNLVQSLKNMAAV